MSDTPHLDKVLALAGPEYHEVDAGNGQTWRVRPGSIAEGMANYARQHAEGGRTRDYERVVHGREEHVSGYMSHLRGLLSSPQLGHMWGEHWNLMEDNGGAHREMADAVPGVRVRVGGHLRDAAAAIRAGDRHRTISHLAAARDVAMYHNDGRAFPALMRKHIAGLNRG